VIDREKAEVYRLLTNLVLKVLVVIVLLLTWIALVVCLILKPNIYVGAVTAIAGFSFRPLFTHFLPTVSAALKRKAPTKN
jgi:hypothetical protein